MIKHQNENPSYDMNFWFYPRKVLIFGQLWYVGKQYSDVTMSIVASHMTSISIVCSNVYSGAYQREHESSALLAFVRGIRRWPVDSPHKGPVTREMFPFDDIIMSSDHDDKFAVYPIKCTRYIAWARQQINTLRPRQNGRHFADNVFKCIFLDENVWISLKISLKFVANW